VRVVDDEIITPTSTAELAKQMLVVSGSDSFGLYHATAEGSCSWFEFAQAIFAATNTKVKLTPAAAGEFPTKVPRPKYSVLENQALKHYGLNIFRPWEEGLSQYVQQLVAAS
jgi:dTDP-4-dehydrorhamnose reductase